MTTALPALLPPPEGAPCNGCGACCVEQQCVIGQLWVKAPDDSACPALMRGGGRFACGLVVDPESFGLDAAAADAIGDALGVGRGCDSDAPPGAWA